MSDYLNSDILQDHGVISRLATPSLHLGQFGSNVH
jgi:hypothetical protein